MSSDKAYISFKYGTHLIMVPPNLIGIKATKIIHLFTQHQLTAKIYIFTFKFQSGTPDSQTLEQTAVNLLEGHKYVFRVAAENKVGVGAWAELRQPVLAKSQHGKSHKHLQHILTRAEHR